MIITDYCMIIIGNDFVVEAALINNSLWMSNVLGQLTLYCILTSKNALENMLTIAKHSVKVSC